MTTREVEIAGELVKLHACELCDTVLVWQLRDGLRLEFTAAHTPEFCRVGTLERLRGLEAALKAKDEHWQHVAAQHTRQVDELLAKEGLPTLTERAREAELAALLAARDVERVRPADIGSFIGEVPAAQPVMVASVLDEHLKVKPGVRFGIGPGLGEMLRVLGVDPRSLVDQKPGGRR